MGLPELKSQRGVSKSQLTKMKTYMDTKGKAATEFELQTKLEMLESYMINFNNIQSKIEQEDSVGEQNSEERDTFEDGYFNLKSKILSFIAARRPSVSNQSIHGLNTSSSQQKHVHHLPKLDVPKFDGQITKWLEFWISFQPLIHENPDINPSEKLQYLKQSLKGGKAETILQSLDPREENYEDAIRLVKSRYYKKRFLFQSHVNGLFDQPPINRGNIEQLHQMIDQVNAHMTSMKSIATTNQILDGLLIHILSSKLDHQTQLIWEEQVTKNLSIKTVVSQPEENSLKYPTWSEFCEFLERTCDTHEILLFNKPHGNFPKNSSFQSRRVTSLTSSEQVCPLCGENHFIYSCSRFFKLSQADRYKEVKRLSLCLNCLKTEKHLQSNCPSRSCKYCSKKHHSMLHVFPSTQKDSSSKSLQALAPAFVPSRPSSTQATSKEEYPSKSLSLANNTTLASSMESGRGEEVLLSTAVVQAYCSNGDHIPCRILLDSGSQSNFVTESFANLLRSPLSRMDQFIGGIGKSLTRSKYTTVIKISSRFCHASMTLEAIVLKSITSNQPSQRFDTSQFNIPSNIELADRLFNIPQNIDILLGNQYVFRLLSVGQLNLGPLVLQKTLLGWIAAGSYFSNNKLSNTLHAREAEQNEDELSQDTISRILGSFYLAEEIPTKLNQMTTQEKACEDYFLSTHRRNRDGRYIVKLPFKDHISIGESYDIALKRFHSLEKKFARNTSLFKSYKEFIDEYQELGHMEPVCSSDWINQPHFVLPHHPVFKNDSSTTRLRVVFDGSLKTTNGYSLNDCLLVGPTIQQDLFSILTRFRFHRFVLAAEADITKMYRQVNVHEADQHFQLILWRDNPSEEIQVMKLTTFTYGTSAASYLAIRSMVHLAEQERSSHTTGSEVILNDFYVDNMLTGADSLERLAVIKNEVTQLLQKGGFPLRKWMTNEDSLLSDIGMEDREKFMVIDNENIIKTLGLRWIPDKDSFMFTKQSTQEPSNNFRSYTKRYVLSKIGSFFDPLGLLAPLVVSAKLFMRHLWMLNLQWDESLPQDLQTEWDHYERQLQTSSPFTIPRHVIPHQEDGFCVHGFCDASTQAYGACIYIKSGGYVRLLCAKSKVASVKPTTTLPRLELCSALLLAELVDKVRSTINLSAARIYCWTDSTICLSWIQTSSILTHTFVANRIQKIQALSENIIWRHVPGELNPADLASRGALAEDLAQSSLWFNGPRFLLDDTISWPCNSVLLPPDQLPDYKELTFSFVIDNKPSHDIISSSLFANDNKRITTVFAYIRRFSGKSTSKGKLTNKELYDAELIIARYLQMLYYPIEYKALSRGQQISVKSSILSLVPFLDEMGVMRVGGRLKNAPIPFDAKHQILLPAQHSYTKAILRSLHHENMHCGSQALLYCLRQRYWIPSGRRLCTTTCHHCIICFKSRPRFLKQLMAHLPQDRVSPCFPFAVCGVDFCGPFTVKFGIRNRNRAKMYVALFICFVTKAVHLEIVANVSTDAFISTLQQFISRRGKPLIIYSDNATNFRGTNNRLRDLKLEFLKQEHHDKIERFCQPDIQWSFIPARSPHFGGLWESGVKIVKRHLNKKIALYTPTENELRTVVYQIEAIVNSRPISPISNDANDLVPLTPGHFIIGRPLTTFNTPSVLHLNSNSLNAYHRQQHIIQEFWKSFHREYLSNLQVRNINRFPGRNLQVGDLVLLVDENTPTLKWKSGVITKTFPGDDNLVRAVDVKSNGTIFRRAATRVCLLPMEDNSTVEPMSLQGGRYVQPST